MLAFFLVQAIGVLYAVDAIHPNVPNFYFGVIDAMVSALNNLYLPAALALALPIFAVLAWWKSWWRMFSRCIQPILKCGGVKLAVGSKEF